MIFKNAKFRDIKYWAEILQPLLEFDSFDMISWELDPYLDALENRDSIRYIIRIHISCRATKQYVAYFYIFVLNYTLLG